MSLPVFYTEAATHYTVGQHYSFTGPEARHALTVTRHEVGDHIILSDGTGTHSTVRITAITAKDSCQVEVIEKTRHTQARPQVTIIQALPKAERSELAIDLAVQAGADAIIPWQAQRCIAKWVGNKAEKGRTKWENMATQAARQSRRPYIPPIHPIMNTKELCAYLTDLAGDSSASGDADTAANVGIFLLHEEAPHAFKNEDLSSYDSLILIIGPEGGIGAEECEELIAAGARLFRLGPEVVRTATAACIALAAIGVRTSRWDIES